MRMNTGKRNGELCGSNNGYLGRSGNLRIGWILHTIVPSNNCKKGNCRFYKDDGLLILCNANGQQIHCALKNIMKMITHIRF